jgi:putative two-component system response regulator
MIDGPRGVEAPLILLVDDEPAVLASLNDSLRGDFRTRIATGGERAIEMAFMSPHPDLVLLDVEMPGLDGYEVCRILKADEATRDIPLIFLSARREVADVTRGFDLGAADYVLKPVIAPILRARVRTQLRLVDTRRRLQEQNRLLERLVSERTAELTRQTETVLRTQETTIFALGSLAETRDNETGNHIRRTQGYVKALCEGLRATPDGRSRHDAAAFELIWKSAPLHDIGKVGIPDSILLKPGKLTDAEFEQMKQHTILGRKALGLTESQVRGGDSFLAVASQIACYHHEKWDGRGYPEGLAGEAIPLPARLMAVADVYDALVSARVYKAAMPHADAVEIIRGDRGKQFDPAIVDCFLDHTDTMQAIADCYADHDIYRTGAES